MGTDPVIKVPSLNTFIVHSDIIFLGNPQRARGSNQRAEVKSSSCEVKVEASLASGSEGLHPAEGGQAGQLRLGGIYECFA